MKDFDNSNYRKYKPLQLGQIMPFGKYKGMFVNCIIERDNKYMQWVINNCAVTGEVVGAHRIAYNLRHHGSSRSYSRGFMELDDLSDNGQHQYDMW